MIAETFLPLWARMKHKNSDWPNEMHNLSKCIRHKKTFFVSDANQYLLLDFGTTKTQRTLSTLYSATKILIK
jgi:hypothetical protein